ncbi:exportin-2-like [Quillaja saponaria]|uniref:Exportin-2-like n=1 Tax=Quillaja saponaria TaxID=32244 RepID=A0AAD7LR92_QUISA|nr:exportin-2-like [Quillaja saponaria]
MEWNPETLQFLSQWFIHAVSHVPKPPRQAESSLAKAAGSPNYGLAVLRLVAEPSIDVQIRQASVVNFKNHLHAGWVPAGPDDANVPTFSLILDPEEEKIKSLIVPLHAFG